jgi:hypothetical protein
MTVPRNVVFVVADALRADRVGAYAEEANTPNLDALARDGVVFENAISQAPWTRPSVGSLLTGLYPSQHGLADRARKNGSGLAMAALGGIPTLPAILSESGLATAAFVGGNANLKQAFGITRGFSYFMEDPSNDGGALVRDFGRWLEEVRPEGAFCYLHLMDVHNPLPAEIAPSRLDGGLDVVEEGRRELVSLYEAAVGRVDGHVGEVVRILDEAGILDDTLLIFTSDHGEELDEHGAMLAHGHSLYRELVRVPLIVRLPDESGAAVEGPVELIDLAPTVLDFLGHEAGELPGKSLLPFIRGEAEKGGHAFSELLRRDRYVQSVTTGTYHLIQRYVFDEAPVAAPADLEPGLAVDVVGQPVKDGPFLATKLWMRPSPRKVHGTVEGLDDGSVTVMGLSCVVDGGTKLVGLDDEGLSLGELSVGDRVTVVFGEGWRAEKVKRRKPGAKSRIGGEIEAARDLGDARRGISVLGIEIVVGKDTIINAPRPERAAEKEQPAPTRVLTGDFVDVHNELYDLRSDPSETENVAENHPEVVVELEEALMLWTDGLASGASGADGSVDVDPETMEQLRRMGYLE